MKKNKNNVSGNSPKNTEKNGRDEFGKFTTGNDGKPKGAINKTARDLRDFITGFLNEKAHEIPTLWDNLHDKDKLSLFMHLSRLVMPKTKEINEMDFLERPIFNGIDLNIQEEIETIRIFELPNNYRDIEPK